MFNIESFKVNHQENPINIVEATPYFSWKFKQESSDQKAYRILVSSAPIVDDSKVDMWDSGLVESDQMIGIAYQGNVFQSRKKYYVRLISFSVSNETSTLDSFFETALINEEDWLGKWVSLPASASGGTLYIRKKIEIEPQKVARARAYVCGLGYYEFSINEKKVTKSVLNPGETNYNKTILYDTVDITPFLTEKEVVFGFELGYGWYGARVLKAQLYIEYTDGTFIEEHTAAGPGWWVSRTPVTHNSIYDGETYDARIEEAYGEGWCSPKFEPNWDNGWMFPIYIDDPQGKMVPQTIEPIEVRRVFNYKTKTELSPTVFVYDIGQNLAGWNQIKVKGERGSYVVLKHGEGLKENGEVNQLNLRSAKATDTYILKGEGIETYAPRFTYHGFQYVQVELFGKVEILDLEAHHVFASVAKTGFFECSDSTLNQLHQNAVITEENNLHSILTDCPQRDERWGWLNDLTVRLYQVVYNFDMAKYLPKIANDILETQDKHGAIADTAPYHTGGQPADLTTVSYLLLGLKNYQYYGNIGMLKKAYDGFKKWVDYLLTRQKEFIVDYAYYADWVSPEFEGSNTNPIYVSTTFLYWHLTILSDLASYIDHDEDAKLYQSLAEQSKKAINQTYFDPKTYNYSTGTQAENSIALSLGLVDKKYQEKVAKNVADNVIKYGYHSTCGNQAYRHLFYVLTEYGYIDILIKMIKNPEYPGWGYMLTCGATTVWERWESTMANIMHSYNHPMFGSYDAWFYRYFAGIQIDGFAVSDLVIKPYIPKHITYVNATFDSVRGKIESHWKKESDRVIYDIVIPANSKAKISLEGNRMTVNGVINKEVQKDQGRCTITVSSGHYQIIMEE